MSNQHHSPKDQIDLLSNTVNRARDLSWWRDAIWGDEEAIHASGNGRINAYLYTLLVLKPDADLDKFKQKCFSYFQKRIGYELVKWDSTAEQWGEWLKIAEIKPELFHYIHGNMLKAGSGYKNFFYRNQGDLNQLIQCYSNRDSVSRGGVIAEIRKEQGFNIHKKKAFSNQQPTIPFWRDVPQDIKIAFENLVINNALDRDIKTYLITQAQLCTLEVWQNLVMEAVGQCGFEKITSIDGLDEFLYESTADDPYFKLYDEAPSRAREKAIWGYRYPGAPS
jgi:hypothetical protein